MDIITLLADYVRGLLDAEDQFIQDLGQFPRLEQTVSDLSRKMAADFLSLVLSNADELLRSSGRRKARYNAQRRVTRTLISTVGDVTFDETVFRDRKTGEYRRLLGEMLRLPERERFTSLAEAKLLNEAEVHSYQRAADAFSTGQHKVTKTTVMNKIHAIEEIMPEAEKPEEKKQQRYLYIEADEDHIHRQKDGQNDGCMIGKLIYLFEGKEDICEGRRELIHPFYFGGLYPGDQNSGLWDEVENYIRDHYDQDYLKCVYINSDGAAWIKAGKDRVYKSRLVSDRFHLMKYINRVARLTGDKKLINEAKGRFYRYIYKDKLLAAEKLLTRIKNRYGGENAVEDCRSYFENNWDSIQRAFHDKKVLGCSAEGHVSHVLSERMSSRPMGWSEVGSDRMCRLRCYVRNYGREKIVDLVTYRREKELEKLPATGTDGLIGTKQKKTYTQEQRRAYTYVEKLQATIGGTTARKILAIREQIDNI
ncbi:MAG: ISLre2 family transposase [Lachnospiraceae bacterium]|nr:ISLre2 family transposase [Lachnospiraceae bacterium]